MKNILIMGIGRAGKTTLSKMIKNKWNGYNIIHSDSLKWAMIRAKGKEPYYREHVEEQKEFEHSDFFQRTLLEHFKTYPAENSPKL
jgi:adenylate kinase family enzyme